jgi:ABC-2 type transport system permease protein
MNRLVRSELLKISSTRMWWGLGLGALAYVALNVIAQALAPATEGTPALADPQGVRNVWASAGSAGAVFALVLGILGMTTEYRHQTVSSTFLATPRRSRVVTAKMLAHAGVGLGIGLACCALTAALAVPLLAAKDAAHLSTSTILAILAGALMTTALYAVMGVAVGALIRNQVAAILGALVWLLLVEALVVAFLPEVGRWLPGGAASALLQASTFGNDLLAPWAGALLLLAYALLFAGVAMRTTLRRDVT